MSDQAADAARRFTIISSKRSSHHAFLEGLLFGRRYIYHNNVVAKRDGSLSINRTVTTEPEAASRPLWHVASYERLYELPGLYSVDAFRRLEERYSDKSPLHRVIYLRDPLNTLASSYSAHIKTEYFSNFRTVLDNAKQWATVARYLMSGSGDEIFIYANRFWKSDSYRQSSMDALEVETFEISERLSRFAGGGNTYLGNSKAPVTPDDLESRYLAYVNEEKFRGLMHEYLGLFREFSSYVDDSAISSVLNQF